MGHKMDHQLAAAHAHHHHHHHVGNKVLPITEANVSALVAAGSRRTTTTTQDDHQKKDKKDVVVKSGSTTSTDNNKIKAITRMKLELLRWAAAAKQQSSSHEKGAPKTPSFISRKVAYFRNRGNTMKALRNTTGSVDDIVDDVGSLSSPKISFKWDVVSSCSTSNSISAYSTMSLPCSSSISRINNSDRRLSTKETTMLALPAADNNNNQLCTSRFGNWITTDDEFVVLEL